MPEYNAAELREAYRFGKVEGTRAAVDDYGGYDRREKPVPEEYKTGKLAEEMSRGWAEGYGHQQNREERDIGERNGASVPAYNAGEASEKLREEFETFRHQYATASSEWQVQLPLVEPDHKAIETYREFLEQQQTVAGQHTSEELVGKFGDWMKSEGIESNDIRGLTNLWSRAQSEWSLTGPKSMELAEGLSMAGININDCDREFGR